MFSAKIDNRTKKTIKSVEASFIQRTTFIAGAARKHYNHKLATALYSGATIGPGTLADWPNVPFQIPIVCPSLLDTCKIIKLEYMLTLVVQIDTFIGGGIRLDIPIVIVIDSFGRFNRIIIDGYILHYSKSNHDSI